MASCGPHPRCAHRRFVTRPGFSCRVLGPVTGPFRRVAGLYCRIADLLRRIAGPSCRVAGPSRRVAGFYSAGDTGLLRAAL